ncbi:MAG TPA: hypothetical protein VM468_14305, partial [Mycoplana sp.]|nr:hypothetical protein [Mycoplana sp.]
RAPTKRSAADPSVRVNEGSPEASETTMLPRGEGDGTGATGTGIDPVPTEPPKAEETGDE